jgi:ABC-type Fe3+-hydroxamate transport system substrate-binding protein
MPSFTDQTGRFITLQSIPKRIVSLVPSLTELLFYFGLDTEVVGITKFCIHPQSWFRNKTRVGGTKHVSMDVIHSLQPDLIIANKEENVKEQVEELARHYPVWVSDVNNLEGACEMIECLGEILGKEKTARDLVSEIRDGFNKLNVFASIPAAYLIWRNPYMSVGTDTFIYDMLLRCGFTSIINKDRYPQVSIEELRMCEVLLLSSEPFPFSQKHIDELQPHLPGVKIILVDGEMFSWYGSRLLQAPAYFKQLRENLNLPPS